MFFFAQDSGGFGNRPAIAALGDGVGANYREATRARSKAEYAAKVSIGLMELEETAYWLELLEEGNICTDPEVTGLQAEANELSAILVSMIKKVRQGIPGPHRSR